MTLILFPICSSGDRLHILPIQSPDLNRRRFRRVLPPAVEPRVRGDAGRKAPLQLRSSRNTEHSYLPHQFYILQCILDGSRHVVPLLP